MSTNKFLIYEFSRFLASSGRNGSRFGPSSEVIYSGDDVFIPLCSFWKRSYKIDSYSFPWCGDRNWKEFILFSCLCMNLTLMTRLDVVLDLFIHLWPIILYSHFLNYFGGS